MAGLAARDEDFNDHHRATAARAWLGQCVRIVGRSFSIGIGVLAIDGLGGSGYAKQVSGAFDIGNAIAIGEQAVMANAMQAFGQDMHQEPADELMGCERHSPVSGGPVAAVVLVAECDPGGVSFDQSAIGDGDTMGVARQVCQDGLGAGKRLLGVYDPFGFAQWFEPGIERRTIDQRGMIAKKV